MDVVKWSGFGLIAVGLGGMLGEFVQNQLALVPTEENRLELAWRAAQSRPTAGFHAGDLISTAHGAFDLDECDKDARHRVARISETAVLEVWLVQDATLIVRDAKSGAWGAVDPKTVTTGLKLSTKPVVPNIMRIPATCLDGWKTKKLPQDTAEKGKN